MQRPHVDLDRGGCVGRRIARRAFGQVVREAQQAVELRDGERELREVEFDILGVPDEREEVVGDEFDLARSSSHQVRKFRTSPTCLMTSLSVSERIVFEQYHSWANPST
jgi:hypothetical protein